jgi:hypothetical protein
MGQCVRFFQIQPELFQGFKEVHLGLGNFWFNTLLKGNSINLFTPTLISSAAALATHAIHQRERW